VRFRWTRPALADLEEVGDLIAQGNPRAAERMMARIVAAIDGLSAHSEVGRPGRIAGNRELVISETPYLAPYRVRDGEVQILAVFHGSRRWPDKFG
jgi:toxin ParE1/3/4